MLAIMAVLVGVLGLLMPDSMSGKFHDVFVYSFGPLLKIGTDAHISALPEQFAPSRTVDFKKYQQLANEKDDIEQKLKTLQRKFLQLHSEYELATGTRGRLPDVGPGHIWAEVITFGSQNSTLDINRGARDGLKTGQYVIGQDCLVGTISRVNNYSARVELLTSSSHELIAEVEAVDPEGKNIYRRAILKGDGKGGCLIGGVGTAYKIKTGNFVYAYARAGYLNSPLVIGKVSSIEHDKADPLFWDIKVQPGFDVSNLKKVFAVTMEPVGEMSQ